MEDNVDNLDLQLGDMQSSQSLGVPLHSWDEPSNMNPEFYACGPRFDAIRNLRLDARMLSSTAEDSPYNISQSLRQAQSTLPLGHMPSPLFGQGKSLFSPHTKDYETLEDLKYQNEVEMDADIFSPLVPVKPETASIEDGLITPQYCPTAIFSTPPHVFSVPKNDKEAPLPLEYLHEVSDSEFNRALEEVTRNFRSAPEVDFAAREDCKAEEDSDSVTITDIQEANVDPEEENEEGGNHKYGRLSPPSQKSEVSEGLDSISPITRGATRGGRGRGRGRGGSTGRPVGRPRKYPIAATEETISDYKQNETRTPTTKNGRGGKSLTSIRIDHSPSSGGSKGAIALTASGWNQSNNQHISPLCDADTISNFNKESESSDFTGSENSSDASSSELGCISSTDSEPEEDLESKNDEVSSFQSERSAHPYLPKTQQGKRKLSMYSSNQTAGNPRKDSAKGGRATAESALKLDAEYLKGLIERKEVTVELLNSRPNEKAMDTETRRLWRRVRRMIKNRQSAQLSRQRKREQLSFYQGECDRLHSRCEQLRRALLSVRDGLSTAASSQEMERLIRGLLPKGIDSETPRAASAHNTTPSKRRRCKE